jgi:hypothetical protein
MSEQQLKAGNFEELRGGHRNLPGNGALPGARPSRGVVQLARIKSKRILPPARPKFKGPKR